MQQNQNFNISIFVVEKSKNQTYPKWSNYLRDAAPTYVHNSKNEC